MMTRAPRAVSPRAISLPYSIGATSYERTTTCQIVISLHEFASSGAPDARNEWCWPQDLGVTHREVISFRNDDLPRSREQFLPALLKAKRIVPLAKYGE